MTERFGTMIKTGDVLSDIMFHASEKVAKDFATVVNSLVSEERRKIEKLVVVRVEEVIEPAEPVETPLSPPGIARDGFPCGCPCHHTPGLMHIVACCHPDAA
ncbi:hypothetical protein SEA_BIG4_321 [Microbacterium phage Big4]|nr:hypothetical protein SEA_BIG4_321 [Microbacterium phage Big4]